MSSHFTASSSPGKRAWGAERKGPMTPRGDFAFQKVKAAGVA